MIICIQTQMAAWWAPARPQPGDVLQLFESGGSDGISAQLCRDYAMRHNANLKQDGEQNLKNTTHTMGRSATPMMAAQR